MLIEIILFLLLGILFGTLTGLIPGIHINLIGVLLISASASLLFSVNPIYFVVFISSMAITHTFIDFIPSIFLGCPDTDTELSVLPGHELLKKGQGYQAIILTCYGSLAAIFILTLIAFPSILLISKTYGFLQKIIPYILILVSFLLIALERKKFKAVIVFLLAGLLGLIVLNLDSGTSFFVLKEPLLPLLTGLFGASMLVTSIQTKTKIPKQKITKPKIKKKFLSPFSSFLPGLGSGQAAIIGNTISRTDRKGFLILLGATNTLVMGFSFVSLYIISRTRTGAAVAIQKIIGEFSWKVLVLILSTALISGIVAFFLTIFLAKFFSKRIDKINYSKLSLIILVLLAIIILLVSNVFGLIILIISTFTGIYCISLGVRRTNMMGCLLLPTIIFYLF